MPIHMRMRKLRGPHMKKSMPFEMFRTHTQPVNIADLDARFESGAEVTIELLKAKGLGTRKDIPIKILAKGELQSRSPFTPTPSAPAPASRSRLQAAPAPPSRARIGRSADDPRPAASNRCSPRSSTPSR